MWENSGTNLYSRSDKGTPPADYRTFLSHDAARRGTLNQSVNF